VKGSAADIASLANSRQVAMYWDRYRLVLVTNLWEFALVGDDGRGNRAVLKSYQLADDEPAFWAAAALPGATVERHDAGFIDFLRRVMVQAAPLTAPRDLAWFLASYARQALARVERGDLPALRGVREALEGALGLSFEGAQGEHFFRSTLVQTLFYGIFSAWVLWCKEQTAASRERFDWHGAAYLLRVPMIRGLFEQVATPGKLRPLGLTEILDRAGAALNRVDRGIFFERFEEDHAVQYFYEPFLEAFDPELRRQLGVWYTPPEVVRYMVARVDAALREELGRPAAPHCAGGYGEHGALQGRGRARPTAQARLPARPHRALRLPTVRRALAVLGARDRAAGSEARGVHAACVRGQSLSGFAAKASP